MKKSLYFFLLISSLLACHGDIFFKEKKNINNEGWSYNQPLSYLIIAEDTIQHYDMSLLTEHKTSFGYENVYILIETIFPNGQKTIQQLSIELMDQYGSWLGDCSAQVCQLETYLKQNFKFPQAGEYRIVIHQYGREDNLLGINSQTLKITNINKK